MDLNQGSNTTSSKWKTPTIQTLGLNYGIFKLMAERKKYKNSKNDIGKRKYNELKNKINREVRSLKDKWFEEQCKKEENLLRSLVI